MKTFSVGDRIEDSNGCRGTIRYIGKIESSKDPSTLYYGIEWDEYGRGLNDGSVVLANGEKKQYFQGPSPRKKTTTGAQNAVVPKKDDEFEYKCSFVKESKFESDAMYETHSLIEALLERYHHHQHQQHGGNAPPLKKDIVITGQVGTLMGKEKPIELVGVHKLRTQQKLDTIEKIGLSHCKIAHLGDASTLLQDSELKEIVPQMKELDLSANLFSKWSQIFEILSHIPTLETLILSENRLEYDISDQESNATFVNVKSLVMNRMAISWPVVFKIVNKHFPSLQELHVAENEIQDQDLTTDSTTATSTATTTIPFQCLEILDLSKNVLTSWKLLADTFGSLPSLKQLLLNQNQISTLVLEPNNTAFGTLNSLSITDNLIDSWKSIDALNHYKSLDTFRLMRNPLTAQMGTGEARMIIIARAGLLQTFNGSEVRVKERKDAEQLYLKRILHELATIGATVDDVAVGATGGDEKEKERILSLHPRFQELCRLYPEFVATAVAAFRRSQGGADGAGPSSLSSSLIRVKISPMSMKANSFDSLEKKLPEKMRISQVKILVKNKYGIETYEQSLSFRMDSKSMPIPLDDDNCEVGYYGIQDGAEILVNDV